MMCSCFLFKQKTAYDMRISDWSSDVCSSDLLLRSLGLVLALHREFVLCLAGDLELLGDILRRGAHVVTVEGIPQAIADHGVDEAEVAHLLAGPQIGGMGRLAHAFLAAGDDAAAEIGRASCRARVGQSVSLQVCSVSLN